MVAAPTHGSFSAYDGEACAAVFGIFVGAIFAWLRATAKRELGLASVNNLFYMPSVAGGTFMKLGATALTLADWRTAAGNDVNSLSGSPGFAGGSIAELNTGATGTPRSQAACMAEATQLVTQLQLAAGSLAIDAGANLGADFSDDFLGLARPVDGNGGGISQTDIGAFAYQGTR